MPRILISASNRVFHRVGYGLLRGVVVDNIDLFQLKYFPQLWRAHIHKVKLSFRVYVFYALILDYR